MAENLPPIMPLWERYQQCLVATDPTELLLIIDQLEQVVPAGAEPPSWMRFLGQHVTSQPFRASVDPQALSAACIIRAAAVMAQTEHLMEAQALYRRVQERYAHRDWGYYVKQAQEGLVGLEDSVPAVVASR
jgi:hypothetical protein